MLFLGDILTGNKLILRDKLQLALGVKNIPKFFPSQGNSSKFPAVSKPLQSMLEGVVPAIVDRSLLASMTLK